MKFDYNKKEGYVKLTMPVLLLSFEHEFDLTGEPKPATPAIPGSILKKEKPEMSKAEQKKYRSGTGKLMHLIKTRPEMLNPVRELSKFMIEGCHTHVKAMKRAMAYALSTPKRGLVLKPNAKWDGDCDFEFVIGGISDSNFATDPDTRKSVAGWAVFLCGAPVEQKSKGNEIVTLSVSEAELVAAIMCAQSMLACRRILLALGLKVKLPMVLEVDNKAAKDIAHNWSVSGRTRHIDVRAYFLRDLKEAGILIVKWIPGKTNPTDPFTKNVSGSDMERHGKVFVGKDEYMQHEDADENLQCLEKGVGMRNRKQSATGNKHHNYSKVKDKKDQKTDEKTVP